MIRRRAVALLVWLAPGTLLGAQPDQRAQTEAPVTKLDSASDPVSGSGEGDGVYGRFDGDLSLSVGAGAELDPSNGHAKVLALVASRVYQTAGPLLTYRQATSTADPIERSLSAAIAIEPLFLLRWSNAREWGNAFFDLTLDSLAVSAGFHLSQERGGTFAAQSGGEFGLGLGLPLLAVADGPWLRGRANLITGRPQGPAGTVFLYLEWQWLFHAGILE